MPLPTYEEISRELGIARCRGIKPNGQRCYKNHDGGNANGDGFVHWSDRRATRGGIRRFLQIAAMIRLTPTEPQVWRRYWKATKLVEQWLGQIRVRIPLEVTAFYRATLKAMIVGVGTYEADREEAMRWASKGGSASSANEASPPTNPPQPSSTAGREGAATTSPAPRRRTRARPASKAPEAGHPVLPRSGE